MKQLTKKTRGRPKVYDRDEALETAMQLFWTHGYEGVSIAELCAALGITPPSLYAAFGSKDQLFREALDLYVSTQTAFIRQAIAEEATAAACVERILRECARRYASGETPAGCLVGSGILRCAPAHDSIAELLSQRRSSTRELFAARLKAAVASGELDKNVDTDALARLYAAVVQGMSVQAIDGASAADLDAIATMAIARWPQRQQST